MPGSGSLCFCGALGGPAHAQSTPAYLADSRHSLSGTSVALLMHGPLCMCQPLVLLWITMDTSLMDGYPWTHRSWMDNHGPIDCWAHSDMWYGQGLQAATWTHEGIGIYVRQHHVATNIDFIDAGLLEIGGASC
eukprot:359821-Chlamydomonas_euryale.AAC.15